MICTLMSDIFSNKAACIWVSRWDTENWLVSSSASIFLLSSSCEIPWNLAHYCTINNLSLHFLHFLSTQFFLINSFERGSRWARNRFFLFLLLWLCYHFSSLSSSRWLGHRLLWVVCDISETHLLCLWWCLSVSSSFLCLLTLVSTLIKLQSVHFLF